MSSNKKYLVRILGLPYIETIEDLSVETRLSVDLLVYSIYRSKYLYKTYCIPKKSGGYRTISQPSRTLKAIQSWILRNILDKLSSSEHSHGFEKGGSILHNASPHIGSNFILSLDLEDFFPSIKANKVYSIFKSLGYNSKISSALTNLCVFNGVLPQGAPTSPKLANLICFKLDSRIYGYAGPRGIVYSRYADDITLSAQSLKKIEKMKKFVETIIVEEDLSINEKKTKILGTRRRKEITGLVLTEDSIGIGRVKYREIRAKIHHLFTDKMEDYNYINGILSFVYDVDLKRYRKLYSYIEKLKTQYPNSLAIKNIRTNILQKNNK